MLHVSDKLSVYVIDPEFNSGITWKCRRQRYSPKCLVAVSLFAEFRNPSVLSIFRVSTVVYATDPDIPAHEDVEDPRQGWQVSFIHTIQSACVIRPTSRNRPHYHIEQCAY